MEITNLIKYCIQLTCLSKYNSLFTSVKVWNLEITRFFPMEKSRQKTPKQKHPTHMAEKEI